MSSEVNVATRCTFFLLNGSQVPASAQGGTFGEKAWATQSRRSQTLLQNGLTWGAFLPSNVQAVHQPSDNRTCAGGRAQPETAQVVPSTANFKCPKAALLTLCMAPAEMQTVTREVWDGA